jgi:ketosteroid isomerase-like protein
VFVALVAVLAVAPRPAHAQGFAQSVAVGDGEVFVGEALNTTAPGYVYVYRRDAAGKWVQAERLMASDAAAGDHFGRTLAFAEGDLLVGSTVSRESGALYVFRKDSSGAWREVQSMTMSDAVPDNSFGRAGATDGRTVVMSDWAHDGSRGAVYVFEKQGDGWRERARIVPDDVQPNDWFGASVAITGDLLAVGVMGRNEQRGGLHILRRGADGAWTVEATFAPMNLPLQSQLGTAVAIADGAVLVSAPAGPAPVVQRYVRDASGVWALAD